MMTKYNKAALRLKDFLDLKLNIQAVKLIEDPADVPAKAENAPAETAGKPVQRSAKQPAEQNAAPAKPAGKKAAWAAQLEEAMKSVNQ